MERKFPVLVTPEKSQNFYEKVGLSGLKDLEKLLQNALPRLQNLLICYQEGTLRVYEDLQLRKMQESS
jgi:hypothetical protein